MTAIAIRLSKDVYMKFRVYSEISTIVGIHSSIATTRLKALSPFGFKLEMEQSLNFLSHADEYAVPLPLQNLSLAGPISTEPQDSPPPSRLLASQRSTP